MGSNSELKIWKKQDTILVNLPYNDFDASSSNHFKGMLAKLFNNHDFKCLIFDFSNVVLVDGNGLASIVLALSACEELGIKLIVCSLNNNIMDLINAKGLNSILDIFDNVHGALDMATYYSSIDNKQDKTSVDIENVFGNIFEENIDVK
jgi:anti-anti-sigma factor